MKVTIQNKEYNIKSEWRDITLLDVSNVLNIEIPEELARVYDTLKDKDPKFDEEYNKLNSQSLIKVLPKFYGEVISCLSDIPEEVMNVVGWEDRTRWYHDLIERKYLDLYHQSPSHESEYIESFEHKGETFYFPEMLQIFGQHIPMYNEKAITFAEESDIILAISNMGQSGFSAMSEVAAVMCRKKDEEYSEDMVIERSKLFSDLTMDIIWEVFFYTVRQCNTSAKLASTYTAKLAKKELERKG